MRHRGLLGSHFEDTSFNTLDSGWLALHLHPPLLLWGSARPKCLFWEWEWQVMHIHTSSDFSVAYNLDFIPSYVYRLPETQCISKQKQVGCNLSNNIKFQSPKNMFMHACLHTHMYVCMVYCMWVCVSFVEDCTDFLIGTRQCSNQHITSVYSLA